MPGQPHLTPGPDARLMVWLGHPFFSTRLPELGWRVIRPRYTPGAIYTPDNILALTDGAMPDMLFVADASVPPFVLGMERLPCLTAFYAVDAHIHSWYPLYAQAFDICLVGLRDYIDGFCKGRLSAERVWWTPHYARDEDRPPALPPEPEWDALFVGTLNPALAPQRHAFISALQTRLPNFHVQKGRFTSLYPKARLVLNETARGELNFRVFEALGCGACLLTPDTGPPLTDLFTDGKELFLYPEHDVDAVLALARCLLAAPDLRRSVAAAGLAAVDAGHRASHRAADFSTKIAALFANGEAESLIHNRLQAADLLHKEVLRLLYLHHAETVEQTRLRQIYLQAARQKP